MCSLRCVHCVQHRQYTMCSVCFSPVCFTSVCFTTVCVTPLCFTPVRVTPVCVTPVCFIKEAQWCCAGLGSHDNMDWGPHVSWSWHWWSSSSSQFWPHHDKFISIIFATKKKLLHNCTSSTNPGQWILGGYQAPWTPVTGHPVWNFI